MDRKSLIVLVVGAILVVLIAGAYLLKQRKPGKGLFFNIFSSESIGTATENPLENMPDVNPMENVANPYTDNFINPFE